MDGGVALVDGDDAHHLTRVLRRGPGAAVSVADGSGAVWQGRIEAVGPPTRVRLEARHEVRWPRPTVTVVQALPAGRKLDEVVRRLSELGVDRLQPVVSARSENRPAPQRADKAARRWQAVAFAAAKQARRAWALQIEPVRRWPGALAGAGTGAVLWEQAGTPLGAVLDAAHDVDEVALGVGPEGGLTADEVAAAALPSAGLGATILRTETAAVAACAVALHRVGRFA